MALESLQDRLNDLETSLIDDVKSDDQEQSTNEIMATERVSDSITDNAMDITEQLDDLVMKSDDQSQITQDGNSILDDIRNFTMKQVEHLGELKESVIDLFKQFLNLDDDTSVSDSLKQLVSFMRADRLQAEQNDTTKGGFSTAGQGKDEDDGGFFSDLFGKSKKGMTGLLGGLSGLFKTGLGLITKIALPLLALKGAFDAFQGFNNAAEITGKAESALTMYDKLASGLAGLISGLSFGLLDTKSVFKKIDSSVEYLFGGDGVFPGIGDNLRSLNEFLTNVTLEDVTGYAKNFVDKIGDFFTSVKNQFNSVVSFFRDNTLMEKINIIKNAMNDFIGEDGLLRDIANGISTAFSFTPIGLIIEHFDKIKSAFNYLFGEGGLVPKIASTVSDIFTGNFDYTGMLNKISTGIEGLFSENGIFSFIGKFVERVQNFSPSDLLPESVKNLKGKASEFFGDLFSSDEPKVASTKTIVTKPTIVPKVMNEKTYQLSKDNFANQRQIPAPIVNVQQAPAPQIIEKRPIERSTRVDDLGLLAMNSLAFE